MFAPKSLTIRAPCYDKVSRAHRILRGTTVRASTVPLASIGGKNVDESLPLSLFYPPGELPPEGRTQFAEDEFCDVAVKHCKTTTHTWEQPCDACGGEGYVITKSSNNKNHRLVSTCLKCCGLGYVRKTSARIEPSLNNGTGHLTIARKPEDPKRRLAVQKAMEAEKKKLQSKNLQP